MNLPSSLPFSPPLSLISQPTPHPIDILMTPPSAVVVSPKSRTTAKATLLLLLLFSLIVLAVSVAAVTVAAAYFPNVHTSLILAAGFVFASLVVVAATRAVMVAWITVLVLLAFAGKRRKVLVQHGQKITADIVVNLFRCAA